MPEAEGPLPPYARVLDFLPDDEGQHAAGGTFFHAVAVMPRRIAGGILTFIVEFPHPGLPGLAWSPPLVITGWTAATLLSILVLPWLLTPEPPTGVARWCEPERSEATSRVYVMGDLRCRYLNFSVDGTPAATAAAPTDAAIRRRSSRCATSSVPRTRRC